MKSLRQYIPKFFAVGLLLLSACQSAPTSTEPTVVFFPTVTLGQVLVGDLPTPRGAFLPEGQSNPATAIAVANQPTPTADTTACPPLRDNVTPPSLNLSSGDDVADVFQAYLDAGGSPNALNDALEGIGFARGDVDLTGEGANEIIIGLQTPRTESEVGSTGSLLIFACANGRYTLGYNEQAGSAVPDIISTADLNVSGLSDLLYAAPIAGADCEGEATCGYVSQIVVWDRERGRFLNLMTGNTTSENAPALNDIDQDRVLEVVFNLTDDGNAETGPLRTGYIAWDWDGVAYVRSVVQYDPPRFRVQIVFAGDEAFRRGEMQEAINFYTLAIDRPDLDNWQNDDDETLTAYALYRLLLAYAETGDTRLVDTQGRILNTYPDAAAAPVYVALANAFWEAWNTSENNLRSACLAVQAIIAQRQEAVTLLNRYGSRNPTYTAGDLCPF